MGASGSSGPSSTCLNERWPGSLVSLVSLRHRPSARAKDSRRKRVADMLALADPRERDQFRTNLLRAGLRAESEDFTAETQRSVES